MSRPLSWRGHNKTKVDWVPPTHNARIWVWSRKIEFRTHDAHEFWNFFNIPNDSRYFSEDICSRSGSFGRLGNAGMLSSNNTAQGSLWALWPSFWSTNLLSSSFCSPLSAILVKQIYECKSRYPPVLANGNVSEQDRTPTRYRTNQNYGQLGPKLTRTKSTWPPQNSAKVNSTHVYKTPRPKFIRQLGPYIFFIAKY